MMDAPRVLGFLLPGEVPAAGGPERTKLPPYCPCGAAWSALVLEDVGVVRAVVLECGQACRYLVVLG
jgi:hypothetical protein